MFCKECGNAIEEGARFCANCGEAVVVEEVVVQPVAEMPAQVTETPEQPVEEVPVQSVETPVQPTMTPEQPTMAPVQPIEPNPMFAKFTDGLKGFFSSNITKALGIAAKSQTMEWILYAVLSVLSFSFAMTIGLRAMTRTMVSALIEGVMASLGEATGGLTGLFSGMIDLKEASKGISNQLLGFGGTFGVSLAVAIITYALLSLSLWIVVTQIFKKKVTFVAVLNMVGFASLPLTCVSILNIVVSFIYAPIAIFLFIAGVIISCVLLYVGIQKLDKLDKTPFFAYAIVILIVVAVALSVGFGLYSSLLKGGVEEAMSAMEALFDSF